MATKTTTKTTAKTPADVEAGAPEVPNVFRVFKRLTQGEKLRLMQTLQVDAPTLGTFPGPAFFVAVAWKIRKAETGKQNVTDLLDLEDDELLAAIGVTEDQLGEQAQAEREAADDDSKSGA